MGRNRSVEEVVFSPVSHSSPWWRWPENVRTGRAPWFVVLRRIVFWLPLAVGLMIAYLSIIGGYGRKEAKKWLSSAM